jgi:hypothetical protein
MAVLANDPAVAPRRSQQRARVVQRLALALARCWLLPGQTKGSARQPHGPPPSSAAPAPLFARGEPLVTSNQSVPCDTAECTLRWPW